MAEYDTPSPSATNEPVSPERKEELTIIDDAIAEFAHIATVEQDNRAAAVDDLKFVIGEQWDAGVKAQRITDKRPCLTINQLPQFVKDVVNDARQRRPQIKILRGEDGDPETAKIIDGLVRQIQYASSADAIYDSGLECSVKGGFGYWRVLTKYTDPKSFDQEICLQRIRNPFTVYYGEHVNADGSDVRNVFVTSWMKTKDFERDYPGKATVSWEGMGDGDRKRYAEWCRDGELRVVERFCRKFVKKKLVMLQAINSPGDKIAKYDDELAADGVPEGYAIAMRNGKPIERDTHVEEIWWYKLTCRDVLDSRKLDGRYIPIVPVWGEETDVEGRTYRNGLIRFAKDPARSYNYWFTTATELIALAPKAPYIGAEGMFKGHESKWRQANTISFPYLEYAPKVINGVVIPPPQRQPFAEMPQGVMQMILIAREDLRTTTGKYVRAELASEGPEQSGKALGLEKEKGELSSFNYIDNLARAIELTGRIIVDLIPHVCDRDGRRVMVRKEDGQPDYVTINEPEGKKDVRKGKYDVVVSVGPSFATRRQEGLLAKLEFMKLYPNAAPVIADLVARGSEWDDADRIADRLKAMLPPEIKAIEDSEDLENLSQDARELVISERSKAMQLQQTLEQTQQALAEAAKQLDDKNAILATDRYKADVAAESKVTVAEINGAIKVATSDIQKRMDEVMQTVGTVAQGLSAVSSWVEDMRKREQQLAAEEAAASAKATAGPTPSAVRPEAASGQTAAVQ